MKRANQIFSQLLNTGISCTQSVVTRALGVVCVIGLALVIVSSALAAEKTPSGTIEIDETQFGFIIGGDIGKGQLHYHGVDYIFKTGGIKVGGVGIAKVSAAGEVYDLFDISQFPGTYVAGDYGIALGGGVGGLILKNQNGVILHLKSTMEGIALSVGAEGLTIKLEDAVADPQ